MRKQECDYILSRMLEFTRNVSDLNITVGKPFQVESSGQLIPVEFDPSFEELTPFQTEILALNLINNDRRLTEDPSQGRFLRFVLCTARKGQVQSQYLFAAAQILDCASKAGNPYPQLCGSGSSGILS